MGEYYGVERSPEYLAHHGVRGMRWGFRKNRDTQSNGHSMAYNDAKKKLERAGMIGGAIGVLGYAATHRDEMRRVNDAEKRMAPKQKSVKRFSAQVGRPTAKEKAFADGLHRAARRGGIVGALTIGGGAGGSAVSTMKYIREHPKEYDAYKKRLKKMRFGDRMREIYRNA